VVRVRDRDFDDWGSFEAWLMAAPAHADAYHRLATEDRDLDDILPAVPTPMPVRHAHRKWAWPAVGGALAALLVGVVAVRAPVAGPQLYEVATGAGERRAIMIEGGTSILLNGGSTLILDRKDKRFAELKRGEALFTVTHDAARPFSVRVGTDRLVDVGTRFDVVRTQSEMRVAVGKHGIRFVAPGHVPHQAGEEGRAAALPFGERHFEREGGPVLAPALGRAGDVRDATRAGPQILLPIFVVPAAHRSRHQHLDILPDDIGRLVAKDLFHRRIGRLDDALHVDDGDGFESIVEERTILTRNGHVLCLGADSRDSVGAS